MACPLEFHLLLTTCSANPTADSERAMDSPGWDAIDRALAQVYHARQPDAHFGAMVPWTLGGPDPIRGVSVRSNDELLPKTHTFVDICCAVR